MKKVIVTAGPIPAKLDSVKIITNMFKGGLAVKTAEMLQATGEFDVEIVKWKGTEAKFRIPDSPFDDPKVTSVEDFGEYRNYLLQSSADAYILAAAVANLMPVNPWRGKFPSHNYEVGEEFDIRFCIAPRVIDEIKEFHPRSTLIGYKLFDGTDEELVDAGWETLCGSRSNVVFCNRPSTAAQEKITLLPDGTQIPMSFDEHIEFIKRVINLKWYSTEISDLGLGFVPDITNNLNCMHRNLKKIQTEKPPYMFGTIAMRIDDGFITTTRGKRGKRFAKVHSVNHTTGTIVASQKATMNAPFIHRILEAYPDYKWVLHGHRQIDHPMGTYPYCFSGTTEETELLESMPLNFGEVFNIQGHGYYAFFKTQEEMENWVAENYPTD